MQLKQIQAWTSAYKDFLRSPAADQRLYVWESQRIFQAHWDVDAPNFADMYDRSLDNTHTRRLWKRERYEPKRFMLEAIALAPEMVRQAFLDLFDDSKDLEARVGRFVFYCDELLRIYRETFPGTIETAHYHDDKYEIISLYLAFRYPDRYSFYEHAHFHVLLQRLGSTDLPTSADFGRFCKVMRTLYGFLLQDSDLLAWHRRRLLPEKHYTGESLLLVYDFYRFCSESDVIL